MKNIDYKITVNRGSEGYFSYTDRLNSYIMLHASDCMKNDGFITGGTVWFHDFYLVCDGKKITRFEADKIELNPESFTVYFSSLEIELICFLPLGKGTVAVKILNSQKRKFDFVFEKNGNPIQTEKICDVISYIFFNTQSETGGMPYSQEKLAEFYTCNEAFYQEMKKHLLFDTGNSYVNKALFWAQASGLNLCTGPEDNRGIWAGLPWFRDNWGRDTFIALPGLLLVSGFFEEAKTVIRCFANHQNKNPLSPEFGRIPNRYVSESDVIFNTAEGNLWFVKTVWEYLQYTGDREFLSEVWETIKLAVFCDLELRCDSHGFLLNQDADTWMDARIEGKNALSPRGNRANDVQSLWYETLNIFVKMSALMKSNERLDEVVQNIELLKESFSEYFWNKGQKILADCIHDDDERDYTVRPNQLLCINVENHLLEDKIEKRITETCVKKLALPHGVTSLCPSEIDFHPYHDGCSMYHKDAAYHNGAIWHWLNGPLISAMAKFGMQDKAFELTEGNCYQILERDCLGTLSENADAALDKYNRVKNSGTWSQAWSVSEFARNFYQDYLGVKPALMDSCIYFTPRLPKSFGDGSTVVYAGSSILKVIWTAEKKGVRSFTFEHLSGEDKSFQIKLCNGVRRDGEDKVFVLEKDGKLSFETKIFALRKTLRFAKLKPLSHYKCLKEQDYLFNKILKK